MVTLAALRDGDDLSFTGLQDLTGLTPGNLITHLRKLEEAGFVVTQKNGGGVTARTSVALTGRRQEGAGKLHDRAAAAARLGLARGERRPSPAPAPRREQGRPLSGRPCSRRWCSALQPAERAAAAESAWSDHSRAVAVGGADAEHQRAPRQEHDHHHEHQQRADRRAARRSPLRAGPGSARPAPWAPSKGDIVPQPGVGGLQRPARSRSAPAPGDGSGSSLSSLRAAA